MRSRVGKTAQNSLTQATQGPNSGVLAHSIGVSFVIRSAFDPVGVDRKGGVGTVFGSFGAF